MEEEDVLDLAKALIHVKRDLQTCTICGNITDQNPCYICSDQNRDHSTICVIQDTKDLMAMERTREYTWCLSCAYMELYLRWRDWSDELKIPELLKS